jgi:acyl-CoA dehydrogenase
MPDRSFFDWPFFEESHRRLAREIWSWCERELPQPKEVNVADQCRTLVNLLGRAGWLRYVVPSQYGGVHETPDVRSLCMIREALAYHSGLAEFAFAMQGLASGPIVLAASEELKRKHLPQIARGEMIGAFAISEPDAGSDVRNIRTKATLSGDSFEIHGTKSWISNAGLADFYITFCRFPVGEERRSVALIVDSSAAGMTVEAVQVVAAHPIGNLHFTDCRVPASNLLGQEGDGLKIALSTLDIFRPTVGAAAVGFSRRALDEAVRFAKHRQAFGQALSDFQMIQAKLAEMALAIDASALLVYRAAWTRDVLKHSITREAAMAKLHATEEAQRVIDEAVQILGARGVLAGSVTERLYREVRSLRIYEGTTEIQKLIIASQVLKAAGESHAG